MTIVAVNHGPTVQSSINNLLYDIEREKSFIIFITVYDLSPSTL